ncbi:ABC transporter, membrane spanning protein (Sugar) [Vibrio nigripulchritudo SO65]|uniref:carbohydrate ABC transporter permease n=1 Tax=Vibrio nigripulchritudo TaxID=28173 RepID=UPI0003B210F0|nr:sugar ABC transporter permease [Vibrio nigripulchritudo]CCN36228.1 ABC transporter, membrane spanning protein (Sugar) [Vibrio nigripulchritudo AM115]CCN43037.1 ABC transporter, membrane spanning protein (Sugar) [Vibrio nigripulchritudo FTn2]CCN65042.1 ABC transporter, membrane spanning protein (Sugar) [Vibrio nigripulchritudo POn4]CCN77789.1 ABC transporter, membrane spanning protein (Sugar) [Vibrio nigripulchritudo SO65]
MANSGIATVLGRMAALPAQLLEPAMRWVQKTIGHKWMPWFFLTPNLIVIVLFALAPVFINIFYSVTGTDNIWPSERNFLGLQNYQSILACEDYSDPATCTRDLFWRALLNSAIFVPLQVILMVSVALITAVALNKRIRARGFFRGVFFFPVMLSPVVVAFTWQWILQRNGALNGILTEIGLEPVNWLVFPDYAFTWVIFVTVWAHMGFFMIILLAGLQSIPVDVYEAAKLDRASPWRVFWKITVPLLRPVLLVVFVLAVLRSVQTFDEVYVLTGGGPGSATLLMVQYIYEIGFAVKPSNYGLAAAASLMLLIVLLIFTILQLRATRKTH